MSQVKGSSEEIVRGDAFGHTTWESVRTYTSADAEAPQYTCECSVWECMLNRPIVLVGKSYDFQLLHEFPNFHSTSYDNNYYYNYSIMKSRDNNKHSLSENTSYE